MSKFIIDHTLGTSGDSWLEIAGEILTIHRIFPDRDIEIHIQGEHSSIDNIRELISMMKRSIPWLSLKEVGQDG